MHCLCAKHHYGESHHQGQSDTKVDLVIYYCRYYYITVVIIIVQIIWIPLAAVVAWLHFDKWPHLKGGITYLFVLWTSFWLFIYCCCVFFFAIFCLFYYWKSFWIKHIGRPGSGNEDPGWTSTTRRQNFRATKYTKPVIIDYSTTTAATAKVNIKRW